MKIQKRGTTYYGQYNPGFHREVNDSRRIQGGTLNVREQIDFMDPKSEFLGQETFLG